jgi:hypothetical protein
MIQVAKTIAVIATASRGHDATLPCGDAGQLAVVVARQNDRLNVLV